MKSDLLEFTRSSPVLPLGVCTVATPDLIYFGNGSDSDSKYTHCGFGTVYIESNLIIPAGLSSA